LTPDEFTAFEARDPFINTYVDEQLNSNSTLIRCAKRLTSCNFIKVLKLLAEIIAKAFEHQVTKTGFNELGALQLQKEV
jgi:hypothetical protein